MNSGDKRIDFAEEELFLFVREWLDLTIKVSRQWIFHKWVRRERVFQTLETVYISRAIRQLFITHTKHTRYMITQMRIAKKRTRVIN